MTTSEQNIRKNHKEKPTELIKLIEESLDMKRRGFILSNKSRDSDSREEIIFNSAYCRISFSSDFLDQYVKSISIFYGRLHAPNNGEDMLWNGEICATWHSLFPYVLPFLDGITPQEDIDRSRNNDFSSSQLHIFAHSEIAREILSRGDNIEYNLKLHGYLWDYYGQKLFDLLDLRQPQLWDQYRHFLSEYKRLLQYKIIPGDTRLGIDKVC